MIKIDEKTYLAMKKFITSYENKELVNDIINEPYIKTVTVDVLSEYNPEYGDNRECKCGHVYYRHFDSYEEMEAIGCKYCRCYEFVEKNGEV